MSDRGSIDTIRRRNRILILETLRRSGAMARIELGRLAKLAPATISSITNDMLAEGLLRTVSGDTGEMRFAGRGRPRVTLDLDPRAAMVLGIKLSINTLSLALADYTGAVVDRADLTFSSLEVTETGLLDVMETEIRAFLEARGIAVEAISEISIAGQGFVDSAGGTIVWSPALSVRNVAVTDPLALRLGVPCIMSNDANMIAQALNWADPETYGGTFAVIFVDYGVGMGLFINGQLYSGQSGAASEFGHMNHQPEGPLCRCGRRGCLEAFVSQYAIWRRAHGVSPLADPRLTDPGDAAMRELEARARSGEEHLVDCYREAGIALGYGIARLMSILSPGRIVLTGSGIRAYPLMQAGVAQGLEAALVEDLLKLSKVDVVPWDRDLIANGAIAAALRRLDRDRFAERGTDWNELDAESAE